MKRWALPIAMFSMLSVAALWAEPNALTTLSAVHRLTNAEAAHERLAVFEATVTYFRPYEKTMFVQVGDEVFSRLDFEFAGAKSFDGALGFRRRFLPPRFDATPTQQTFQYFLFLWLQRFGFGQDSI